MTKPHQRKTGAKEGGGGLGIFIRVLEFIQLYWMDFCIYTLAQYTETTMYTNKVQIQSIYTLVKVLFAYRAIHGNTAANTNTDQYRAAQAKYISIQYNNYSVSGKLYTFCFSVTENPKQQHHRENIPVIHHTHLFQLPHNPTIALITTTLLTLAPQERGSREPPNRPAWQNPGPARSAPKPWRWTSPRRPAGTEEKKTQPGGKKKKTPPAGVFLF